MQVTAFEHYMLADDRPAHPMTFWVRATLTGTVDEAKLRAALRAATRRHPLATARLLGDAGARTTDLRWETDSTVEPYFHAASAAEPLAYPHGSPSIDLTRESGLRLFVRRGSATTVLLLQVHHATSDAAGAVRFLDDVLAHYGQTPLRPVDQALLAGRGEFHVSPTERRRRLVADLGRILLFFRRFPQPLATTATAPTAFDPGVYPASVKTELATDELDALKSGARGLSGTVNDLLLRDLFVTLDAWNRSKGGRRPLRLAMPINMRRYADHAMPLANVVSMCFLDRAGTELDAPDQLLSGIVRETRSIKDGYLGYALIRVAEVCGQIKGGLRLLVTPRFPWQCAATATLSNLGEPLRLSELPRDAAGRIHVGDLVLESLELLPPVRPNTGLAFGAVTYAGKLALTLHYDHAVIGADEATALLDAYRARLDQSMDKEHAREESGSLLARLLREHAVHRQGASAFYSLPIGKNVAPIAVFTEKQLPPAPPRTEAAL